MQIDKEADVILAINPEVQLYQEIIPIDFDGAGKVITVDTSGKWVGGGIYTGCVGNSTSEETNWNTDNTDGTQSAECDVNNVWNKNGRKASTTGNIWNIQYVWRNLGVYNGRYR